MNIAFLGGLFPHELQAKITDSSKECIQNVANALQRRFVDGLNKILHKLIAVINLPYIGSSLLTYRHVFIKHGVFGYKYGVKGISVPFCNFILYKNLRPHLSCGMLTPDQMHRQRERTIKTYGRKLEQTAVCSN